MRSNEDFNIFASTIYGEAAGQSHASWQAIANIIQNRIKQGREWKRYTSTSEIIKNTGFDAYTQKNKPFKEAYEYLTNGTQTVNSAKIDQLKSIVQPIYNGTAADNTNGAVLYYSPKAQEALYKKPPPWNFSLLEEVTVEGTQNDDFKFFKYKDVAKLKIIAKKTDSPIKNREAKIKIGNLERKTKTDEHGELPTIITDQIGEKIEIWIENSKKTLTKVYEDTIEATEIAIEIIRNKIQHKTQTEPHAGKPSETTDKIHIVSKGDTLSKIAMLYNISVLEICQENKIKNPNSIQPGDRIKLPKKKQKPNKQEVKKSAKKESTKESIKYRNKDGNPKETIGHTKNDSPHIGETLFPIANHDRKSYQPGTPGAFGRSRGKNRKHGGCDIYAPPGTEIRAISDGTVLGTGKFYWVTNEITIDHGGFIVRYGEVDPQSIDVELGEKVKKGQVIAKVGQLIMPGGKKYHQCMLHFELYSTSTPISKESLTDRTKKPFMRRSDLIDPTATLDNAKS